MQIEINYFGMLTEITGCSSENIETEMSKIEDLVLELEIKYPGLVKKQYKIAQNQELVSGGTPLSGAEIALLPPFSGG